MEVVYLIGELIFSNKPIVWAVYIDHFLYLTNVLDVDWKQASSTILKGNN